MLSRLPYRVQIPLGLSLAVVVAALIVTVIAAQISARSARQETMAAVDHAAMLISAQARPLLAADDTWRVFEFLRNVARLLPGEDEGRARVAVLDADGRVYAASNPMLQRTAEALLGRSANGRTLPASGDIVQRLLLADPKGAATLIEPIRSEDGQLQGFVYIEVDASVFAPDWAALSKPALIGVVLAVSLLVPLGWWFGRRMAQPLARITQIIRRVGREDPQLLVQEMPRTKNPELNAITNAVDRLVGEMQVRRRAERRALSAERMAAVGRLTAAVAHEINNPLGGLLTATQTLRLHGDAPATRERTLDLITRGLQQIRTTVAALMPQARVEDRALEVTDLADAVTLVLPIASRHAVKVHSDANVTARLRVPSVILRQVMLNMLLNAVKAAGQDGSVRGVLEADEEAVRFSVTNTGKRLTSEALAQTIAVEGGDDPRGFGLWVCREIATQYGGGFDVANAADKDTTLMFWIPNRKCE